MNISDIHKLSNKEIVQSISRMAGSPMEKAMKAELEVRLIESVTDLSSNVYTLRLSLSSLSSFSKALKVMLFIICLLLAGLTAMAGYYIFQLNSL
jgi:hypothetical protein